MNPTIRQLRRGELLPDGEPRRYRAGHGYIRLRWKIGPYRYVETYEHRVDGDHVTTAPQVHHKNHARDDNRPENLERLTAEEHWERHGSSTTDQCVALYRRGLGTVAIGRAVARDPSAVYRLLRRRGIIEPRRETGFYARPMPPDGQLREWHAAGVRVNEMVIRACVGRQRLERRLDALGLPRFPPGPSPKAEAS